MPLNSRIISDRVIRKLDGIGIQSRVGGDESETAELVRLIVGEVVRAIQQEGIVTVDVNGTCSNSAGPGFIKGFGTGSVT